MPRIRRATLTATGVSVTLSNGQVRTVEFADHAHRTNAQLEAIVASVTLQDGDGLRLHIFSRTPWTVALLVVAAGETPPADWWTPRG